MTYTFSIEGVPVIQERPRKGMHGNIYDPSGKAKKALGWKLLAARQGAKMPILGGSVCLKLQFHLSGEKVADLDNMAKAFMDAGNGILWKDDRQVAELNVGKTFQSDRPRTDIEITQI